MLAKKGKRQLKSFERVGIFQTVINLIFKMKKLSKKLKLNKETVSALTNEQMSNVKGGDTRSTGEYTYVSCLQDCLRAE
jgi:natural product precursor